MRFSFTPLLIFALGVACSRADSISDPVPPIPQPEPPVVVPPAPLLPLPLTDRIVFWREGTIATVRTDGSDTRVLRSGGSITCPRLSPDGNLIAFLTQAPIGSPDTVWVMAANGKNARPIFNMTGNFCPVWSPDATKLAVIGDAGLSASGRVTMLSPEGNTLATFTASNLFGFSPDASRILIAKQESPGAIISARWDGSDQATVANGGRPDWGTPQRIVYECTDGICSVSADGSNQQLLFTNIPGPLTILFTQAGAGPRISPDGKTVAFACTTTVSRNACLLNIADGSVVVLPQVLSAGNFPSDYPYQIAWSVDSRTIAMTCQFHSGGGKSVTTWTDLCVADRDARTSRNLFGDAAWEQDPTLSPP